MNKMTLKDDNGSLVTKVESEAGISRCMRCRRVKSERASGPGQARGKHKGIIVILLVVCYCSAAPTRPDLHAYMRLLSAQLQVYPAHGCQHAPHLSA